MNLVGARAVILLSGALLAAGPGSARQSSAVVLRGARLLDPVKGVYVPAAVVILDGPRVAAVHARPPAQLPTDAEVIDLSGTTLVPGLGDMSVAAAPSGVFEADFFHLQALAHGITAVRTVDVPLPWAVAQRERANVGGILAPRLWTSGPGLEERGIDRWLGSPRAALGVRDAQSAVRAVEVQAGAGADWIAVRGNVRPALVRAIVAAAESQGLRVSGDALSTPMTVMAGSGVHAIEGPGAPARPADEMAGGSRPGPIDMDPSALRDAAWQQARPQEIRAAVAALVRARTVLITRLDRSWIRAQPRNALLERAELAALADQVSASLVAAAMPDAAARARAGRVWANQLVFVRDLLKAGGSVVPGSGAGLDALALPGGGLHRELAHLVAAGLTPAEAIRAATVGWREMVGSTDPGVIRAGSPADFFAVEGDPLQRIEDLLRVRLVVRRGERHQPAALRAVAARAVAVRSPAVPKR